MVNVADRGARKLASSAPLRTAARAGYAVNGVVHALIGATAISIAVGSGGEADQTGALGQLAAPPGGGLVLWVIAIALFALALWQVLHALLIRSFGDLAKAVVYVVVGAAALTFALGSPSSAAASTQSLSAKVLSMPGGVALLILVGLGVFGVGLALIVRGVSRRFLRRITVPPGSLGRFVTALGVIGYTAEGLAVVVVGILFWVAAATFDPTKASGLDGAVRALGEMPFGQLVLIVIGAGFIAYGVYSEFRARYARL